MSNLITVGIVIAILGFIVYAAKRWGFVEAEKEIEKATSRESQKVALDKVEALETAELAAESHIREMEHEDVEAHNEMPEGYTRSRIGFYPSRLHPKDPDDLN